jgi:phage gpG-like protein
MASKPAFTEADLMPKIPKRLSFSASSSLGAMLQMRISAVPASDFEARLEAAIARASQRITADLKQALDDALRSGVWATRSGAADIYETGELLASGSVKADENGLTIAYDAPYAALVHFGGYIHPYGNTSAKVYLPPRPWVQSVLNGGGPVPQFDFQQYYTQEIAAAFRR